MGVPAASTLLAGRRSLASAQPPATSPRCSPSLPALASIRRGRLRAAGHQRPRRRSRKDPRQRHGRHLGVRKSHESAAVLWRVTDKGGSTPMTGMPMLTNGKDFGYGMGSGWEMKATHYYSYVEGATLLIVASAVLHSADERSCIRVWKALHRLLGPSADRVGRRMS